MTYRQSFMNDLWELMFLLQKANSIMI